MAAKLNWTPWHKVVTLRDDVRTGELSLAEFAADLYDVAMQSGNRPLYEDPARFFALTFPTLSLRDLAKDVVGRLAAKNTKAIRQLELTYGGGKTHTLITLFHLVNDPAHLPALPAVEQFKSHIGIALPQARVAALCFDKLDVEKGMEVRAPDGSTRWLKQPWSVLAFQIAGADGLRVLSADGTDKERETPPAEPLLVTLLSMPQAEGLSTLVLIDEVLMFASEKVRQDESSRGRLINFFQYLCQAVVKTDRCALVASLLASDPEKSDEFGRQLISQISDIFSRQKEEGVQPVQKEDVAEVLRRRFFEPDSIANQDLFRQHVNSAVENIGVLEETVRKGRGAEEARFLRSYPFHPDLADIFYVRWTSIEKFQRTRGILRTFALALRDAERWNDPSPLIGPNVFLPAPHQSGISEAMRELTGVATRQSSEGRSHQWSFVLESELEKGRAIQEELPGLRFREIEQAVCAVFLSSQPIGQKARTPEVMKLVGATRPDRIELEKGLRRWTEISWFLDEAEFAPEVDDSGATKALPKAWRLGDRPNLKQMHHACRENITPEMIEQKLLTEVQQTKSLTQGAKAAGAQVHTLPERPKDIDDDGQFHFAVLGPKAASDSGKPSTEARRFIDETTAADRPRTKRNAVILVAPSRDGLEAVRTRIRDYLGWEEVRNQLKDQKLDTIREEMLAKYMGDARKSIPEVIRQAWCIVVAVNEQNEIQAFKLTITNDPLFTIISDDRRARIQESAISAEAILPGGPYDLWRDNEASRRVKDIVGAFAENPRLPRMLKADVIFDTINQGVIDGIFVASLSRADKSVRTIWREPIDAGVRPNPALELYLPDKATLSNLPAATLVPGVLPELWKGDSLTLAEAIAYFTVGRTLTVNRSGYDEPMAVPSCPAAVVESAVGEAVASGKLWLVNGPASFQSEAVPAGVLTAGAVLRPPHRAFHYDELMPDQIPDAWKEEERASALAIALALSNKEGAPLPWSVVSNAIDDAVKSRWLEFTHDSGIWPCAYAAASSIELRLPPAAVRVAPTKVKDEKDRQQGVYSGSAVLAASALQDLVEVLPDIMKLTAGTHLRFQLEIKLGSGETVDPGKVAELNRLLEPVSAELVLKR